MQDFTMLAVEYGGYVSIIKLLAFLALIFPWLPLVGWVYRDCDEVDSNVPMWTGIVLGAGALSVIIWLLVPIFFIGMAVYIIAVGTASLAYVKHRNVRVMDFDRVLTADHIKGLFSRSEDKVEAMKEFTFVTANGNDVELPQPRTPLFYGYKMAHELMVDAIWRRADTVLFTPGAQSYSVNYQVDGVAIKQPEIPKDQMEFLINFMKQLADVNVQEKRKPQKGKFKAVQGKDSTEWELTTAGSTAGEQCKIVRQLEGEITKIDEIGLMPDQLAMIQKIRDEQQGLFIISGPKKSGVTTTFYAVLRNHDAFLNNISTLEKKPSGTLHNMTQTVFDASKGQTYSEELARVIRMGPDIVGIADCTDSQGGKAACLGADDGKLVYVTLEADSAINALAKWMKIVGDRALVAKTLLGVANQRLIRKLCEECKQAYAPNRDLFRKFNINAEKTKVLYRAGKVQYDKHGKPSTCEHCQGTGFVGRTAIFEMAVMNDELRKVVKKAKSIPEIASQFRRAKMLYMQEQALRKVIAGQTSINEMIRVISNNQKRKAKAKAK